MDKIIWTGRNLDDMEAFVLRHGGGFSVGSDHFNWRWYHRLYGKVETWVWANTRFHLPEWLPPEDSRVLEYYPVAFFDLDRDDGPALWTTICVGDQLNSDGTVTRATIHPG